MRIRLAILVLTALGSYALFASAGRPDQGAAPTYDSAKALGQAQGQRGEGVPEFWVRPGYRVELMANVQNARFLEKDDKGNVYVTQPERGTILTMRMRNGKLERVAEFVTGHPSVHGMMWADGWLWFTTSGGIFKGRDTQGDGVADEVRTIFPDGSLPHGGHWWRSILVTKDSFFTSIGDSGNINDLRNTDREKIWRYDLNGGSKHLWSSGIRNTEKLQFRPGTTEMYGCDQGSDNFGATLGEQTGRVQPITDFAPPEEFNLYVEGGFYGHPFITGNRMPRYEYLNKPGIDIVQLARDTIPPALAMGPHWAADGWTFLSTDGLGADLKGDALIAFHGSWNRVEKAGYRIERVLFDKVTGLPMGEQMMVGTLTSTQRVLARPVDCLEMPDGSVLFSDDQGGKIYRLSRVK